MIRRFCRVIMYAQDVVPPECRLAETSGRAFGFQGARGVDYPVFLAVPHDCRTTR